jgi:xanthine dehydrogenase accessory factor
MRPSPLDMAPASQWLQPLRAWPRVAVRTLQSEPAVVRIVMASIQGSAPREPGVCMLVGRESIRGTVGGGQLEWQALTTARALLADPTSAAITHRVVLGGDIGQCCGGVVELWIERYTAADIELLNAAHEAADRGAVLMISRLSPDGLERHLVTEPGCNPEADAMLRAPRECAVPRLKRTASASAEMLERLDDALMPLWLYGAGHVGHALARILMELPVRLTWIDSRADLLPAQVADSVRLIHSTDPVGTVAMAAPGTRYVVMTHSHALDYSLCRAILTRGDFAWAGLIGSHSKAARFRSRLGRHGVDAERIARLVCPIGVRGIDSKWPAAIAVGIATQLLQDVSADSIHDNRVSTPAIHVQSCGDNDCDRCQSRATPK